MRGKGQEFGHNSLKYGLASFDDWHLQSNALAATFIVQGKKIWNKTVILKCQFIVVALQSYFRTGVFSCYLGTEKLQQK